LDAAIEAAELGFLNTGGNGVFEITELGRSVAAAKNAVAYVIDLANVKAMTKAIAIAKKPAASLGHAFTSKPAKSGVMDELIVDIGTLANAGYAYAAGRGGVPRLKCGLAVDAFNAGISNHNSRNGTRMPNLLEGMKLKHSGTSGRTEVATPIQGSTLRSSRNTIKRVVRVTSVSSATDRSTA